MYLQIAQPVPRNSQHKLYAQLKHREIPSIPNLVSRLPTQPKDASQQSEPERKNRDI